MSVVKQYLLNIAVYKNLILPSLIILIQTTLSLLRINNWPLSPYDMFTASPPSRMFKYQIEYVTNKGKAYNIKDFSKVSFEIYRDYELNNNSELLKSYLSYQTQRLEKENKIKIKKSTIKRIDYSKPGITETIYEL